jgi:hypothetical protein
MLERSKSPPGPSEAWKKQGADACRIPNRSSFSPLPPRPMHLEMLSPLSDCVGFVVHSGGSGLHATWYKAMCRRLGDCSIDPLEPPFLFHAHA